MRYAATLKTRQRKSKYYFQILGELIREKRSALGSQRSLRVKLSQQTISRIETAERTCRLETLETLARALRVSVPTLMLTAFVRTHGGSSEQAKRVERLCRDFDDLRVAWRSKTFRSELGRVLRTIRVGPDSTAPRLTMREVGGACGIDHSFPSRIEHGKTEISLSKLYIVCDVLNVSIGIVIAQTYLGMAGLPKQRGSLFVRRLRLVA